MADDTLSQDDIDALLGLGDDMGGGESSGGGGDSGGMDDLNLDALLGGGGGGSSFGSDDGGAALDGDALKALSGMGGGGTVRSGGMQIASEGKDNVELLMDVNLRFTVELGRTTMYIKDVMLLAEGSIVELDKNVGDEVDILVNDRLFGRGRLVIMDEFFGVQITHILDTMERYRSLQ